MPDYSNFIYVIYITENVNVGYTYVYVCFYILYIYYKLPTLQFFVMLYNQTLKQNNMYFNHTDICLVLNASSHIKFSRLFIAGFAFNYLIDLITSFIPFCAL